MGPQWVVNTTIVWKQTIDKTWKHPENFIDWRYPTPEELLPPVKDELQVLEAMRISQYELWEQGYKTKQVAEDFTEDLDLYFHGVPPDGNCLFSAAAKQLYGDAGATDTVRKKVVAYIAAC